MSDRPVVLGSICVRVAQAITSLNLGTGCKLHIVVLDNGEVKPYDVSVEYRPKKPKVSDGREKTM